MGAQDDFFRTQVRFPGELHEKLVASAKDTGRSMNAEIVSRLESSFSAAADQSKLESALADLHARHTALLAEYTRFLDADKTIQVILKPLAVKYGSEVVRLALKGISPAQFEQIKAALASGDEAWIGKVIAEAVEAVEDRLRGIAQG